MRKLVLILIAFIAVVTFIRAFDNSGGEPRPMDSAAGSGSHGTVRTVQIPAN